MEEKKEIIAYAITHAPKGVKGGPYEGRGSFGEPVADLSLAMRYHSRGLFDGRVIEAVRKVVPHARVIRIVRKGRPPEASAVEVLRELVAECDDVQAVWWRADILAALASRARAVLAASGPDPMPVVRAAMTYWDTGGTMSDGPLLQAVDAYRKAGGK